VDIPSSRLCGGIFVEPAHWMKPFEDPQLAFIERGGGGREIFSKGRNKKECKHTAASFYYT